MSIDDMINVLQRAKAGDRTEMLIDGWWREFDARKWVEGFTRFRAVKPVKRPREWYAYVTREGRLRGRDVCGTLVEPPECFEEIKVKEVIE